MSESSCHLFVYGTLRAGSEHAMGRLLARQARLVGPARAPGRLYDLGPYPGMTEPRAPGQWVHGELYELLDVEATLAALDRYEGCSPDSEPPYLFSRSRTVATLQDGRKCRAWVYLYRRSVREGRRIASGDYASVRRPAEPPQTKKSEARRQEPKASGF